MSRSTTIVLLPKHARCTIVMDTDTIHASVSIIHLAGMLELFALASLRAFLDENLLVKDNRKR
ncbi:hypothetical protein C9E85_07095 [Plesiomonas shigelloides]|nr:hypothetical protein C9E85_07095 [Plesiomonas shigelloides]